jgi:uncharacterized membrane protein HdeD (DUF308 family)
MLLESITRNWWVFLLRGICAIVFGVLTFTWPGITLASLVIVFGVYAILDGVTAIVAGFSGGADGTPWWQMVLVGILSVITGVLTFCWPGVTAVALLFMIAAWAIVRGIVEIAAAIRLRAIIDNEGWLIFSGLCSIFFGAVLFARPGAGALAVLWIIGSYAIFFGVLIIALAFRLRSLKTDIAPRGGGLAAGSN